MRSLMNNVRDFMLKHGLDYMEELNPEPEGSGLADLAKLLQTAAQNIPADETASLNCVRAHLVLEETAELIEGLAEGNPIKVLDALADLAYVTAGTALAFDLPLCEALDEVHASNMTKDVGEEDRPSHPRKGANYQPPELFRILAWHWHTDNLDLRRNFGSQDSGDQ